jgi:Mn-dependent DtxR family transcriptional regulator
MGSSPEQLALLDTFLQPMNIDAEKCHALSDRFLHKFVQLSAESLEQFLPTPISESILRPIADHGRGR